MLWNRSITLGLKNRTEEDTKLFVQLNDQLEEYNITWNLTGDEAQELYDEIFGIIWKKFVDK